MCDQMQTIIYKKKKQERGNSPEMRKQNKAQDTAGT